MKYIAVTLIILTVAACSGASKYSSIANTAGFEEIKSAKDTKVFARPGYKKVSDYKYVYVAPVKTLFDKPEVRENNKEVISSLEYYFRQKVIENLKNQGHSVAPNSGKDSVELKFLITGLKSQGKLREIKHMIQKGDPKAPYFEEVTMGYIPDVSNVKIEAQFYNVRKDQLEIVVVTNSSGYITRNINGNVSNNAWEHVVSTFDSWAEGLAEAISYEKAGSN